jgi:hypothetical protein
MDMKAENRGLARLGAGRQPVNIGNDEHAVFSL